MNDHLVFYVPEEVPDVSVHRHSSGALSVAPKFFRGRQSSDAQILERAEVWLPLSLLPRYRIHFLTMEQYYQREKEGSLAMTEDDLATEGGYTNRDGGRARVSADGLLWCLCYFGFVLRHQVCSRTVSTVHYETRKIFSLCWLKFADHSYVLDTIYFRRKSLSESWCFFFKIHDPGLVHASFEYLSCSPEA